MSYESILTEQRDPGVGIITLNRPERLNALTREMADELLDALERWQDDSQVRAVVLTGAGRGFCAGADLGASREPVSAFVGTDRSSLPGPWQRPRWPLGKWVHFVRDYPHPLIAAVNGACVGAGLGLAMACDMRIAAQSARFSSIFVKRGLAIDFSTSYFLPRLVGLGRALELGCTGRMVDAGEAERIGLVNRTVPDDQLMEAALELATEIAENAPVGVEFAKKALHRSLDEDLEGQLFFESYAQDVCRASEDYQEGVQAFFEKRKPVFRGR